MNEVVPTESVDELADGDRDAIAKIAEVIVPSGSGFPSAAEANVAHKWIDRGLRVRPDLREPLLALARRCNDQPAEELVTELADTDAESIEPLVELIVACYFMSPKVRKRLGYRGQIATPILPDETEYYLRDDLLSAVAGKAPLWRPTPDDPTGTPEHKDVI